MVRANFHRSVLAAVASLTLLSGGAAMAQDSAKEAILATVNGTAISTSDLGLIAQELGPQLGNMPPAQQAEALKTILIDLQVIADEAEKQGLDKSEDFAKQMDFLRRRVLRNEFFRINVDEKITEDELKAVYKAQITDAPEPIRATARHILLKEEDEAKAVIKELEGGADFAELAKKKSTGPSAPNGGSLGTFGPGDMAPAFEAAAFALEPGSFSKEPVKTKFGWHVILLEDKKVLPKPTYEAVKPRLRAFVAQGKFAKLLGELKAKAKIE